MITQTFALSVCILFLIGPPEINAEPNASTSVQASKWAEAELKWSEFSKRYLKEQLERDSKTPAFRNSDTIRNHRREFALIRASEILEKHFTDFRFYSYDSPWGHPCYHIFALKSDGEIYDVGQNCGPIDRFAKGYSEFVSRLKLKILNKDDAIDIAEAHDHLFGCLSLAQECVNFKSDVNYAGKSIFIYNARSEGENKWDVGRHWQCGDDIKNTLLCQYWPEPEWEITTTSDNRIETLVGLFGGKPSW